MFSTKICNSYSVCVREFCTFSNKSQDMVLISALLYPFRSKLSKLSKIFFKHRCLLIFRKLHPLYSTIQNRACEIFTRCDPHYSYSSCKVREFHTSLRLVKSESDGKENCKEIKEICKIEEIQKKPEENCKQPCKEKSDMCRRKKVKCNNNQQPRKKDNIKVKPKVKTEQKSACKETCFGRGKCDMPRTIPPPKMEYVKVTCPPSKFVKPYLYAPIIEYIKKEDDSHIETSKQIKMQKNKQICAPLPLPKPPCGPIVLCACPPPSKIHPGPCPCYEIKLTTKIPPIETCPLKKKEYPCPTGTHYCSPQQNNIQKTTRDLKKINSCDHRQKKAI